LLPSSPSVIAVRRTASLHSSSDLRNGGKSECRLRLRFTGLAAESRFDGPDADGNGFDESFVALPAMLAAAGRFRGSGTTCTGVSRATRGAGAGVASWVGTDFGNSSLFSVISRGGASAGRSAGSNGATAGIGSSIPH
jgi:hypothetical protein